MRWLAVLLATLLVVLGWLQHRWIEEVSDAERVRMRHAAASSADRMAADAGHELRRVLMTFHPDPRVPTEARRARLAEQMETWRAQAPYPALVQDVLIGSRAGLERLDRESGGFVAAPWPDELSALRHRLGHHDLRGRSPLALIEAPALAMVMPFDWPAPERGDPTALILLLDRRQLATAILPHLVEQWFGAPSGDLLIGVFAADGPVYLSDASLPPARYLPGDVTMPLFHGDLLGGPPVWRLVVTHRAGSLDAAVTRTRHRHLAISTGVLLLLAASMAVMVVAARRAQRLARQQMDFVAGVTHEPNTPIAAMRSAAQNLADGVVEDPAQVRRYGTLIEREGSRLSALVARTLETAGIHAGRPRVQHLETLPIAEIVDEVLRDNRFMLDEQQVVVERDLPGDLPAVLANRRGLHLAVQNLFDNALKHAADGRWIGVHAAASPDRRSVILTIDDRGPGIDDADRPHIFEPFYRGRRRKGAPTTGSGIGLGLVREVIEAQGGRVEVATGPGGRGASFALHLPVAPDDGAAS